MPHIIVEHSADFSKDVIQKIKSEIPQIMASITEGNFDADQCKSRSHSFDEFLVGLPNQTTASFIHVSVKILGGRTLEARKKLSAKVMEFLQKISAESGLTTKRCDLSVDVVEMDKETYQKARIGT